MGEAEIQMRISPKSVWGLAILFFIAALCTRYHGFSIGAWGRLLGPQSAATSFSWGEARHTRADDWAHDIPYQLSQIQNSFGVVNRYIGAGQNMLAPNKVPVAHLISLARPSVWGFFFGPSIGLSWAWTFLSLGTFLSAFFLFWALSPKNAGLSLVLAVALVFSPSVQFWSYHKSEIFIHAVGVLLGLRWFFRAQKRGEIVWSGIFSAYMLICFGFHQIYPGLQVAYVYAVIALGISFWLGGEWKLSFHPWKWKVTILVVGAVCVCLFFGLVATDAYPLFARISSTVYPGERLSTGGVGYPWLLLSSNLFVAAFLRGAFGVLGNLCESATAIHLAPVAVIAAAVAAIRGNKETFRFFLPLLGVSALFLFYLCVGFPPWLARLSLLGKLTENRVPQILFFLEFIFLCRFLSDSHLVQSLRIKDRVGIFLIWMGMLGLHGALLASRIPSLKPLHVLLSLFANGVLTFLLLSPKRRHRIGFLSLFTAVSVAYTGLFNPLNFGASTRFLYDNPVSQEILRLSGPEHQELWAVVAPAEESIFLSNLPRILGVRSIAGAVGEPQMRLWERFAPQADSRTYNRLTYTYLTLDSRIREPHFENPTPNELKIQVTPDSEAWDRVGVTRVLASGDLAVWNTSLKWRKASCESRYCFYERSEPGF